MLVAGAALGLIMAATDLVAPSGNGGIPPDSRDASLPAVATINGTPILASEYGAALDRFAASRSVAPTGDDSTLVLDALIEEELLVQRARELGIDRTDRLVRDLLAKTVRELVAMDADSEPASPAAVAAFYEQHRPRFARSNLVHLREIRIGVNAFRSAEKARLIAVRAVARLRAGEAFETVARELGDRPSDPLPDRMLSEGELRVLLGSSAARRALALEAGSVSDPIPGAGCLRVLQMLEREPKEIPPLAEIDELVRSEMRRRAQEAEVRRYVDVLREDADIRLAVP